MIKLNAIPCNIITGFLGVGKTTTILNLLKQKPAQEKWAVLVNEFGEIGLDGTFIEVENKQQDVFIREIPGGCMCCASGVPMQIALNMLLMKAQPDRLLIEPTGLGHPKEVLKVLSGEHYRDVLALEHTLTLLDVRHFASPKHLANQTFQQQLDVADVLVVNKADLCQKEDIQVFESYRSEQPALKSKPCVFIQEGALPIDILASEALELTASASDLRCQLPVDKAHSATLPNAAPEIPACGYTVKRHQEGDFTSIGWRFKSSSLFDIPAIKSWINSLNASRVKALLKTKAGFVTLNISADTMAPDSVNKVISLPEDTESRLEIIFEEQDITEDTITVWSDFLGQ